MPEPTPDPTGLLPVQRLDIGALGRVHIQPAAQGSDAVLVVTAPDGTPRLQLSLSADELVIDCLAGSTRLRVGGALQVDADSLRLSATHDLALQCGGDLRLRAGGRIDAVADAVHIEALRGDAMVTANDDVRLEGERIRMNA